tara:strand:- start:316 stop:510 length:195 start_codon:yes stop_codon:yes gene_type:complete
MVIFRKIYFRRDYLNQYDLPEGTLNISATLFLGILLAVFWGIFMYTSSTLLQELYLSLITIPMG